MPRMNADCEVMKPEAGVTPARPAMQPFSVATMEGLPSSTLDMSIQTMPQVEAAMCVQSSVWPGAARSQRPVSCLSEGERAASAQGEQQGTHRRRRPERSQR